MFNSREYKASGISGQLDYIRVSLKTEDLKPQMATWPGFGPWDSGKLDSDIAR